MRDVSGVNTRGWQAKLLVSIVGLTYLLAAVSKLHTIDQVAEMLHTSKLLSRLLSTWAAYLIVTLESLVALGCLMHRTRVAALSLAALLSGMFVAFAVWRIVADIRVPCSCFGPLFKMSPFESGAIAFALFLASLAGIPRPDPVLVTNDLSTVNP